MSRISEIAMSGLSAAQTAMNMTSRNTANLMTPGYTRQGVIFGTHARTGIVTSTPMRYTDQYLNQNLWRSNSTLSQHSVGTPYYQQLEQIMGMAKGGAQQVENAFWSSLSAASAEPHSSALRGQLIASADALAQHINTLQHQTDTHLSNARAQTGTMVKDVNALSTTLGELNKQVAARQLAGDVSSELLDQRNQVLDKLAAYVNLQVLERDDGMMDVNIVGGPPLVIGTTAGNLQLSAPAPTPGSATPLSFSVQFAHDTFGMDSSRIGGGLQGMSDLVQRTLLPQAENLRTLSSTLITRVNQQLQAGFDLNGQAGLALFTQQPSTGRLSINPDITPQKLGFSADANQPGNTDNLTQLFNLKNQPITLSAPIGSTPLGQALDTLVTQVAQASQKNQSQVQTATQIRTGIQESWQALSGVNRDEEALNLSNYMQAYQANLKVIATAQKLIDTTLNAF